MITRVTSSSVNTSLAGQINNKYSDYATLTQQLASGKRVNSLKDDPIQAVNIINSNRNLNRIGIWKANVDSLTNEIKQSSDTIELMMEKAQRAKDLATTAANGTSTKPVLESTMKELNQIIRGMVDMANTNYNGNYIYGGANTKIPAYELVFGVDEDGNQTDDIVGIKYNGTPVDDDWQRQLEIVDGIFQTMNVTGMDAFGEYYTEQIFDDDGNPVLDADGNPTYKESKSGIFADVMKFKEALQKTIDKLTEQEADDLTEAQKATLGSEVKSCYDEITALLDGFGSSINKMTTVNTMFGSITNKLEMSKESLKNNEGNLKEYISGIQEVDVAQAVSDWYSAQYAYQASMQASMSIMSMSLLNYI